MQLALVIAFAVQHAVYRRIISKVIILEVMQNATRYIFNEGIVPRVNLTFSW